MPRAVRVDALTGAIDVQNRLRYGILTCPFIPVNKPFGKLFSRFGQIIYQSYRIIYIFSSLISVEKVYPYVTADTKM